MVKVFLVDSERAWIERLRDELQWEACGCSLVASARDGELALAGIAESQPDILITEIELPRMDGMDLFKEARKVCPGLAAMIVSGSDRLEHAVAAVNLGFSAFLRKPVLINALQETLRALAAEIEDRRQRDEHDAVHALKTREGVAFMRAKIIPMLFSGALSNEDSELLVEHSRLWGVDLAANCYMALEITSCALSEELYGSGQLMKALNDIAGDGIYLSTLSSGSVCGVVLGDNDSDLAARAYAFARMACLKMRRAGFGKARVGLGDPVQKTSEIRDSALVAQQRMLSVPEDVVIAGPKESGPLPAVSAIPRAAGLFTLLRYAAPEELAGIFNQYFASLRMSSVPKAALTGYLRVEALLVADAIVRECGGDADALLNPREYLARSFPEENINRCAEDAYSILWEALNYRARNDSRIGNPGISKARYYLDHHFADTGLMLKDAAREANMSGSRFSTVFAQETGHTFTEYVTGLRIEKAKELLTRTDMRISQVASSVGYNDPHYFSWIFKKTAGMTPSEYRAVGSERTDR